MSTTDQLSQIIEEGAERIIAACRIPAGPVYAYAIHTSPSGKRGEVIACREGGFEELRAQRLMLAGGDGVGGATLLRHPRGDNWMACPASEVREALRAALYSVPVLGDPEAAETETPEPATELTDIGEQYVIPGVPPKATPKGGQGSLW